MSTFPSGASNSGRRRVDRGLTSLHSRTPMLNARARAGGTLVAGPEMRTKVQALLAEVTLEGELAAGGAVGCRLRHGGPDKTLGAR